MEEEYGIELKLLTDKFKVAMSNVSRETKSWADELNDGTTIDLSDKFVRSKELELEIKNLKKELSMLAPDDSAFQEYALAIKEAEDESEAADDDDLMEMSLFSDDAEKVLSDGDFEDFKDMEEGLSESDEDYIERLISEEGNK